MAAKAVKKKTTAIELPDETKALLEAMASGDVSKVDPAALQKLMGDLGMKAVSAGISEAKTRVTRRDEVAKYSKATALSQEDKDAISEFEAAVAKAPQLLDAEEMRPLSSEEQEALVEVEMCRRKVEDISKGLYERDRTTAFNHLTFTNDGDPYAVGEIRSLKHGMKVSVYNSERVGSPNYAALQELVDEDTWNDLTDEVITREVNEEKVAKALAEGNITMEQFASLIPEKKTVRNFTLKAIKEGESV